MQREWKARERAMNEHFMGALRDALWDARLTPTRAAKAAGITQQTLSKWLNADASNGYPVMSAQRFVQILEDNDIEPEPVLADAVRRARAAGLLNADMVVTSLDDDTVAVLEAKRTAVSDPDDKVTHLPIAAQDSDVQSEMEQHESE